MKENVFELHDETNELVVLKVNADDPLTVALYPYVSSDMAYISVTKGQNHILTVILKDGKHGAVFHWGNSGHTVISDSLELLKKKVLKFIDDCNICLDLTHEIKSACLCFNSNFGSWQLTLNDHEGYIWENKRALCYSNKGSEDWKHGLDWGTKKLQSMLCRINNNIDWQHKIAQTGIDIWEAVF